MPPPAPPTSAARTRPSWAGPTATTRKGPTPWPTAAPAAAPPFCAAPGRAYRPHGRKPPAGRAGLDRAPVDAQETPGVGRPDLRAPRQPRRAAPLAAAGRPDVEEGQEAAGQGLPRQARRPRRATAQAVRGGA